MVIVSGWIKVQTRFSHAIVLHAVIVCLVVMWIEVKQKGSGLNLSISKSQ